MVTNAYVDAREDGPPGHLNFSSDTCVLPPRSPPLNPQHYDTHHTPARFTETTLANLNRYPRWQCPRRLTCRKPFNYCHHEAHTFTRRTPLGGTRTAPFRGL
jgi:hypothetical protein